MSYSSTAHLFYGFIPSQVLAFELVDKTLEDYDPDCELVGLGDGRSGMEYAIALKKFNFQQNEYDSKSPRLKFEVPKGSDELIQAYGQKLGIQEEIVPDWHLGISTS